MLGAYRPLFLLAILIACCARLLEAWHRPFWFDEAMAWKMTTFPWGEQLRLATLDFHPPLYWAALKMHSSIFGDGTLALRSLSIVAGIAQVVLMGRICGSHIGVGRGNSDDAELAREGLAGASLVALNPTLILYSAEARMYALGVAFALLHFNFLLRFAGNPRPAHAAGLVVSGLTLVLLHYHGVLVLAAAAITYLWLRRRLGACWRALLRADLPRVAGIYLVVGGLFSPWLAVMRIQMSSGHHSEYWLPPPSSGAIPNPLRHVIDFWSLPRAFIGIGTPPTWENLAVVGLAAVLLIIWAVAGRRDPLQGAALLMLILPMALAYGIGLAFSLPIVHPRYLQFSLAFSCVGLAHSLARVRPRALRAAGWTLAAFWLLSTDLDTLGRMPDGLGRCVRTLESADGESGAIYCDSTLVYLPLKHEIGRREVYLTDRPAEAYLCPFVVADAELRRPAPDESAFWLVGAAGRGLGHEVDGRFERVESKTFFDVVPPRIMISKYRRTAEAPGLKTAER